MPFLDPKKQQQDDEALPGSGVRLDLEIKLCPECRREALPWQDTCPTCGVATVAPADVPASSFPLPHLAVDDEDDDGGGPGGDEASGEDA